MRKVCVITGSRAEYYLLRPLMKEIREDKKLQLQLIATGMHLSPEFGLTYKQIDTDGFTIDKKIKILSDDNSDIGVSKSMALALTGLTRAYKYLKPDIVVVLGDRYEIFIAAAAALISRIAIAHIHGGEITEGAFDDAMRHCITKMSHLHFTSTEQYRRRIIQLGELPDRVFNVGALGVENIKKLKYFTKKFLEKKLNFIFKKHNILVTFHPVTLEDNTSKKHFKVLLAALDVLKDSGIIFTKSNADPGGSLINKMIDKYVSKNPSRAAASTSLGAEVYLSVMRHVDAVVGNSSSGIIEAPSLRVGTINIGDRQKGRIRARSVIDCPCEKKAILKAFEKLYSYKFQSMLKKIKNPYEGKGDVAKAIKNIIKNADLTSIIKKKFYDTI